MINDVADQVAILLIMNEIDNMTLKIVNA